MSSKILSYHINTVALGTTMFKLKYFVAILISFSRLANYKSNTAINVDAILNICLKLIKIKISNKISLLAIIRIKIRVDYMINSHTAGILFVCSLILTDELHL